MQVLELFLEGSIPERTIVNLLLVFTDLVNRLIDNSQTSGEFAFNCGDKPKSNSHVLFWCLCVKNDIAFTEALRSMLQ